MYRPIIATLLQCQDKRQNHYTAHIVPRILLWDFPFILQTPETTVNPVQKRQHIFQTPLSYTLGMAARWACSSTDGLSHRGQL